MSGRIVIHSLEDAMAAVKATESSSRVCLISAPGAAASLGSMAFIEIVRAVRTANPDRQIDAVLDCADAPGLALNALRHGAEAVRLDATPDVIAKVQAIANTTQARVISAAQESPLL